MKSQTTKSKPKPNEDIHKKLRETTLELKALQYELNIEAALELIRVRAMAMHKSEELAETAAVLFQQLGDLGAQPERINIGIVHKEEGIIDFWSTEQGGGKIDKLFRGSIDEHTTLSKAFKAWEKGEKSIAVDLTGKDLKSWLKYLQDEIGMPFKEELMHTRRVHNVSFFSHGMIVMSTPEPLEKEKSKILERFAAVFELTYTRFLDLQKAEAQAREAQIEASLERVRARAMGMHNSVELLEASRILYNELTELGIPHFMSGYILVDEPNKIQEVWMSVSEGERLDKFYLPLKGDPVLRKRYESWKRQDPIFNQKVSGKALERHMANVSKHFRNDEAVEMGKLIPDPVIFYCGNFSEGYLHILSHIELDKKQESILMRFTQVFSMTYRRFLDLKKAEEQAREAQIEAALERIRSKALAMQSSSDLLDVSNVLREQMGNLGQEELESSIIHLYNSTEVCEAWYTFKSTKTNSTRLVTDKAVIPIDSCDYIKETYEKYKSNETEYTIVSKGKKLVDWYNVMVKVAPDTIEYDLNGKMLVPEVLYYHYSKFSGGALLMISNEKPSDEAKELQKRASKVFNLAYQRFQDLQQAEDRARESVKQASLDRVRGEIASMRSKEDLNRITPLIWKELTALDVPFIRCGVFIMDTVNEIIQSYLSAPDGKTLGIFKLPFASELIGELMVDFWQMGKIYKEHWTREKFIEFMQRLKETGQLKDSESYQGTLNPPEKLDLHFIPFKQGMLYVGNTNPLTKDKLELVRSLAEAFSIAYARYEDFRELEIAKNQIEETLNELKSTQSQLIHSEKMASLGELTAGIAHEIQNPLNFVNNFSEVSVDLIEELKVERGKEDREREESLEEEILDDVIQNLEKINHHGQRASSIVKGMLEHSRTGGKDKQLTDINALADEYLRLAYHGLRAKDKSFNADFNLEVDEKLRKIKVFPQDIGRVLLNLINNAFYAVSKKAKTGIQNYKPSVIVNTGKINDQIEIRVTDNGPGIPDEIKEKIFQPFFTTKPTGSGTGLGLSLSYDIIKAHGGDVNVASKEGEGSEFIISIPIDL